MFGRSIATVSSLVLLGAVLVNCSSGVDEPYKPSLAYSGRKASLPAVPSLPTTPIKSGDAYTVYGATHQLRSSIHSPEVRKDDITITGYIVSTNIPDAPSCAIHKTGKEDPADCTTEIPSFVIADTKGDDKAARKIKVMGWASNFANVYDAMEKYKGKKEPPKELVKDEFNSVDIPFPLPAPGAKVKVTGHYGFNYSASGGMAADAANGILTYKKIEYLEPSTEPATFKNKASAGVAAKKK